MEKYKIKLRGDMPPGFLKNRLMPELPAVVNFLKQYKGKKLTIGEFTEEFKKFPTYLKEKKIPLGIDSDIRRGIFLEADTNYIFCHNDSLSMRCVFGELEKIV